MGEGSKRPILEESNLPLLCILSLWISFSVLIACYRGELTFKIEETCRADIPASYREGSLDELIPSQDYPPKNGSPTSHIKGQDSLMAQRLPQRTWSLTRSVEPLLPSTNLFPFVSYLLS